MKIDPPRPQGTIRVIARDDETGKSRSTTFYDTTPEEVIRFVESAARERLSRDPEPEPAGEKQG